MKPRADDGSRFGLFSAYGGTYRHWCRPCTGAFGMALALADTWAYSRMAARGIEL